MKRQEPTIHTQQKVSSSRIKAYALDDSVKNRCGKNMGGVIASLHVRAGY